MALVALPGAFGCGGGVTGIDLGAAEDEREDAFDKLTALVRGPNGIRGLGLFRIDVLHLGDRARGSHVQR